MAAGRRFLVSAWFLMALAVLSSVAEADDGDVLLEVKRAFVGDPEGVLAGWNASGAGAAGFCAWAGVACDDAGLRVVGLNLSGAGLAGPVPRALARLDALEAIDLSANALAGPIPAALGGLAADLEPCGARTVARGCWGRRGISWTLRSQIRWLRLPQI